MNFETLDQLLNNARAEIEKLKREAIALTEEQSLIAIPKLDEQCHQFYSLMELHDKLTDLTTKNISLEMRRKYLEAGIVFQPQVSQADSLPTANCI